MVSKSLLAAPSQREERRIQLPGGAPDPVKHYQVVVIQWANQ